MDSFYFNVGWIMLGQILWFIEKYLDSKELMDLGQLVIDESKYEERIYEYSLEMKVKLFKECWRLEKTKTPLK